MGDGTMCHECRRYSCICGSDAGRIAALEAENKRLRDALAPIKARIRTSSVGHWTQNVMIQASEIEALLAALESR